MGSIISQTEPSLCVYYDVSGMLR